MFERRLTALVVCGLLIALASARSHAETHWLTPLQVSADEVRLDSAGEFYVWGWLPGGGEHELNFGDVNLLASWDAKGKGEDTYRWIKIDKLTLPVGSLALNTWVKVAGVVLTTDENLNPNEALKHRNISAQPVRVDDDRVETALHTDTVFTMPGFDSVAEWEGYAKTLRQRVLLSSGLWPLPERTDLNASVSEPIVRDDYSVSNVSFEAYPGFYVTGNLYRPLGEGPFPGVLSPHGHWGEGRLEATDTGSVPSRAITFARMGIVCLSIDMVGYVDSRQFEHRWSSREEKLWGLHPFALQLWSAIRGLDFLESLPEVDPSRLACTGASGGGTQTFALMAVDPRVSVAAPVNMISSTMQGGCICENAPILRLDNSNMEIGALMAPRPLLMVSATGDWTRETPRVEYPSIRSIYDLYGMSHRIENVHVDAGHNYNADSRQAVYSFFAKWLLSDSREVEWEQPHTIEPSEHLRVFPDDKLPRDAATDDELRERIISAAAEKWAGEYPKSFEALLEFKSKHKGVLASVLGVAIPSDIRSERIGFFEREGYVLEHWVLGRANEGDRIPALFYRGTGTDLQDAVLIVHGEGKASLDESAEGMPVIVRELLDQGKAVLLIDAFLTGEHHTPWARTERRTVGAFSDTFNVTDTGNRIQDILTAAAFLRSRRDLSGSIDLVGMERAGLWSMFAAAVDQGFRTVIADADNFETESDAAWVKDHYVPTLRAIGDVDTAAAFIAPNPLWILNTGTAFETHAIMDAYRYTPDVKLRVVRKPLPDTEIANILR